MKKLLLTVAIGAGVALAILGAALSGQASQRAQAQGPIIVGIDMDPYNTPANSCPDDGTDCTLGSLSNPDDRCWQASPGDTVELDVYVDDLPAVVPAESILGFSFTLGGWPGTLDHPGGIPNPGAYNDVNVNLLVQKGGSLNVGGEPLPDPAPPHFVTVIDFGMAEYNPPYTHGVLGRYDLDLTGVAPGLYALTLTGISLPRDVPPAGDLCALVNPPPSPPGYGCVAHDSTYRDIGGTYGLLAVDQACPQPEAPRNYTLAAGSDNNSVYAYDGTGSLLWSYDTGADVVSVAVSSDGAYIAVGSESNKLYLFDRSGTKLLEEAVPVSYGGNFRGKESKSVAISAHGEYVVAGGTDNLYVYRKDGPSHWSLHWSHAGKETSVGISPSAMHIVSANKDDGTVDFFSFASSTPLWSKSINAFWVATSNSGYVAVGEMGDNVYLYDITGTEIWIGSHSKWVGSDYIRVDMAEDGLSVVAVNDEPGDSTGCVLAYFNHLKDGTPGWGPADGTPDWDYDPSPDLATNDYLTVAISADGESIATGPDQGTVVLSGAGLLLQNFPRDGRSMELSSDGQYGVYGEPNGNLSFFSKDSPTLLWTRTPGGYVLSVALAQVAPVGGIAEYPDVGESALRAAGSPGGSPSPPYAALAGAAAAAAAVAIVAGGWYARRRWLR